MSFPIKTSVLLFKGLSENGKYLKEAVRCGMEASFTPIFQYNFLNISTIIESFYRPSDSMPSAIVLTSPRAVDALAAAISLSMENKEQRKSLPHIITSRSIVLYCLGSSSSEKILQHFSPFVPDIRGTHTTSAAELAMFILNDSDDSKPTNLLYLCGKSRRDELPNALSSKCIAVRELTVYTADIIDNLKLPKIPPNWVVFFSPRGVDAVVASLTKQGAVLGWFGSTKVAAIGATTRDRLLSYNIHVSATALKPNPIYLFQAVRESR